MRRGLFLIVTAFTLACADDTGGSSAGAPCYDDIDVTVPRTAYETAERTNGELTAAACLKLCGENAGRKPHACAAIDDDPAVSTVGMSCSYQTTCGYQ